MTQLALPLTPLTQPDYHPDLTLAERFAAFHESNPSVADSLEQIAAQWLVDHDRVGMKFVGEIARWQAGIQMPGESWAINNSYLAFYARLMIQRHPEWSDAIHLRRAEADRAVA